VRLVTLERSAVRVGLLIACTAAVAGNAPSYCKRTLALMKPGAILVTPAAGRGGFCRLLSRAGSEHLSFAGLMFSRGPLPADRPCRGTPRLVLMITPRGNSEGIAAGTANARGEEFGAVSAVRLLRFHWPIPKVLKVLDGFAEWTPSEAALALKRRASESVFSFQHSVIASWLPGS